MFCSLELSAFQRILSAVNVSFKKKKKNETTKKYKITEHSTYMINNFDVFALFFMYFMYFFNVFLKNLFFRLILIW